MVWMEVIVLKEICSMVEGGEIVHVGDAPVTEVALQPDVQLP